MNYWIHYSYNLWQPTEQYQTLEAAIERAEIVVRRWKNTLGVKHSARIYYGPALVREIQP